MSFVKKREWILLSILGVLFAVVLGMIIYVCSLLGSMQKIEDLKIEDMANPNISQEVIETMEGYWTIALFGVDSRTGDLGSGTLADAQIICNIDRKTGEIRLLSVYRDTYLKVSEKGKYSKINDAYLLGGPSQALSALSENLDMSYDDCVAFNWKAVADAINLLGGIDVDITKDEFSLINGYITETVESTDIYSTHLKHAGMNHLDGVQAVAYARLRKKDTDFKRTERQRTVIAKTLEKAKDADFAVLNNILVTVLPQIKSTISIDDLIPLAKSVTRYHISESSGFPFDKEDKQVSGKDCVIPVTLESNVTKLHEFLFEDDNYIPSKRVKEISEKIISDSNGSGRQERKKEERESSEKIYSSEYETDESETGESKPAETSQGETRPKETGTVPGTAPVGPGYLPTEETETTQAPVRPVGPGVESEEAAQTTQAPEGTLPETAPSVVVKTEGTKQETAASPEEPAGAGTAPAETEAPEEKESSQEEPEPGPGIQAQEG